MDTLAVNDRMRDAPPRKRIGDVPDVARLLKMKPSTVYTFAREKRLPGVLRIGNRVRFDLDKLEAWLDNGGGEGEA